jgi:isopenicillin N synthase-like dioxygenase
LTWAWAPAGFDKQPIPVYGRTRTRRRLSKMDPTPRIPLIDVSALFAGPSSSRDRADRAIAAAASDTGFLGVHGFPEGVCIDPAARAEVLRIFQLPERQTRPLWRRKFDPSHVNIYRGWFPRQIGFLTSKEGIDIGPDLAYGPSVVNSEDPLREATPLPQEVELPGWRASAARYYHAMVRVSEVLMRSLARSLSLPEHYFDHAFDRGLSTLRLIRYPPRNDLEQAAERNPDFWVEHQGRRHYLTGAPHVDSGLLTLLAQDNAPGLQARHRNGSWIDVPPVENSLVVNFGKVLERWSSARIRATEHRVIGAGQERMSVPFFYEARADAEIRPLPIDAPDAFEPFLYGDYLWATTTQFVEFMGMESLRKPMGRSAKLAYPDGM